jgi:hypothetical protein
MHRADRRVDPSMGHRLRPSRPRREGRAERLQHLSDDDGCQHVAVGPFGAGALLRAGDAGMELLAAWGGR